MNRKTMDILRVKNLKKHIIENYTNKRWHWNEGDTYELKTPDGHFEANSRSEYISFVTNKNLTQHVPRRYDVKLRAAWIKFALAETGINPLDAPEFDEYYGDN